MEFCGITTSFGCSAGGSFNGLGVRLFVSGPNGMILRAGDTPLVPLAGLCARGGGGVGETTLTGFGDGGVGDATLTF